MPGALAPVPNALPTSSIAGMLGDALAIPGLAGDASDLPVLTTEILPQKWEAIVVRLHAEPNIALDPTRVYASPAALAAAVSELVAQLSAPLDPAYHLMAVDTYACEPVAAATAGWVIALAAPGAALTFVMLSKGLGFMPSLGFVLFVMFGRCLAALRDTATSPTRVALSQIEMGAHEGGVLRRGASLTAAAVIRWLDGTALSFGLHFLREQGLGPDRREQAVLDRQQYTYGTADQKLRVVAEFCVAEPLASRLTHLTAVLGADPPIGEVRSAVSSLIRATVGGAAIGCDLAALERLDGDLRNAVSCLSQPGLASGSVFTRVLAVERTLRALLSVSVPGTSSAGSEPGGSLEPASWPSLCLYVDELTALVRGAPWRATEAALHAEMQVHPPNELKIHSIIMSSSVLGARVTRGPWYARGCPRDMGRPIAEWCVTQPVTRCACWFRAPALLGWKSGRAVSPAECGHMVRESIWVEEHNVPRSDFLGREAGHLTETCRSATQFGNLSPLSLASRRVVPARLAGVCPARS